MKKNKKPIKYSKSRVVLSDTLPYETPLTFSNRHFYNFINQFEINYFCDNREKVSWNRTTDPKLNIVVEEIIKVLFDLSGQFNNDTINLVKNATVNDLRKIPFVYKITHKEKDFRELSIPHPKSQLELIYFYEKYKELILYYSNISKYSIRKPHAIAKFIFNNDTLHKKKIGENIDIIEDNEKEYESLKTFFTYKKYSNIYKFYEHYNYHRSEKKYDKMFKFDIAKCFDSIYTHSISWALFNKEIVKDNLQKSVVTFPGEFDAFMQNLNYGETNGIIIGPEFSRIFSELILQQIDRYIEIELRTEHSIIHKVDYEIYRYVDDFFVFYSNEIVKDTVLLKYKHLFKEYKMSISDSKTIYYNKPLITELTIAKEKVVELFSKKIRLEITDYDDTEEEVFKKLTFNCSSNHLITKFKIIVKESEVEYKNIMNFTLAILNKRVERSINKFEKYYSKLNELDFHEELDGAQIKKKIKQEEDFTQFIIEILDFAFFLYTVSPRVNSTIKLCNCLSEIIKYYDGKYKFWLVRPTSYKFLKRFTSSSTELIFKKIFDEINLILLNNKTQKHIQIETLYLFIILRELGKDYRLNTNQITTYFKLDVNSKFEFEPNYFTLTVLLFYIRNVKEYDSIKKVLKDEILRKISNFEISKRRKTTELVLLFFDILVCPYIDNKFKREMMSLYSIPLGLHTDMLNFKKIRRYWFTKWDNFNLNQELLAKKSLEVY